MSTHRETVYLVKTEARQGGIPGNKGCGIPHHPATPRIEEGLSEEVVKSFIWGISSGSLLTLGQLSSFFFHLWPALGPSPTCMCNFFPRWGKSPVLWRALASPILGWCPLLLDPQGAFLHMCSVSLAPRRGKDLDLLLMQGLTPRCSCHDSYLKVPQVWLFTLFLWGFFFFFYYLKVQMGGCKYLACKYWA